MVKYNFVHGKNFMLSMQNEKLIALQEHISEELGKPVVIGAINGMPGYDCPAAKECFTANDLVTRKLILGKDTIHNCFGAGVLSYSKGAFDKSLYNSNTLKSLDFNQRVEAYDAALDYLDYLRIHAIGADFLDQKHLDSFIQACKNHPDKQAFGYTKQLRLLQNNKLPDNLLLQYSAGGKYFLEVTQDTINDVPTTYVVTKELWDISADKTSAKSKDPKLNFIEIPLQVNKFDDHGFIKGKQTFGIIVHGTQTKIAKSRLQDLGRTING